MGGEVSELVFAKSGPTVILLAGLQGVGKTTVCAKLAFYLKKRVNFLNHNLFISPTHTHTRRHTKCVQQAAISCGPTWFAGKELHACCWRCLQTCCNWPTCYSWWTGIWLPLWMTCSICNYHLLFVLFLLWSGWRHQGRLQSMNYLHFQVIEHNVRVFVDSHSKWN